MKPLRVKKRRNNFRRDTKIPVCREVTHQKINWNLVDDRVIQKLILTWDIFKLCGQTGLWEEKDGGS